MEIPNQIAEKQNTAKFLEYLAASSYYYLTVKRLAGFQFFLTVVIPILLSIFATLYPEKLKAGAAFYGLTISLLDTILVDKLQKEWKKEAAKIQECFDCQLFSLKWNDFRVGDKVSQEKIHDAAKRFLMKNSNSKLINWYSPSVQELPLPLARIVCQRSNIYWDSELRSKYTWSLKIITGIIVITSFVTALIFDMSMTNYIITILAPIFPTLLWLTREIKKQQESVTTLDRLMKYVNKLWQDVLTNKLADEHLEVKSRELQDELYTHRYSNQPIFNWIYNRFRSPQEEQMNVGAKELVEQIIKDLK